MERDRDRFWSLSCCLAPLQDGSHCAAGGFLWDPGCDCTLYPGSFIHSNTYLWRAFQESGMGIQQ